MFYDTHSGFIFSVGDIEFFIEAIIKEIKYAFTILRNLKITVIYQNIRKKEILILL